MLDTATPSLGAGLTLRDKFHAWGRPNFLRVVMSGTLRKYALAVLSVLAAILIRAAVVPVLGPERFPFLTFFGAIVFCAWFCGLGPSILAVALSGYAAFYIFFDPVLTRRFQNPTPQVGGILLFLIVSAFIIALGESNRRTRVYLEDRILERTVVLRSLTSRLIQAQDSERRRFGRELHDSAGQLIAALSMNIAALQNLQVPFCMQQTIADSAGLVEELSRQVRTISHLLHPPLLDETGLRPALSWCVDGFSQRSKIGATLRVPDDLGRFESDVEIAVYRLVQEGLTNVHRHSGSKDALVDVNYDGERLSVTVCDHGNGITPEKLARLKENGDGIGLSGMQQRFYELGGRIEICSNRTGTMVTGSLPTQKLIPK
jgi:signal transduction histidine kinase